MTENPERLPVENSQTRLPNPWFVLFGIIVAWLLFGGILPVWISESTADRGSFGDMFGAVNALFSGLALAGVIYAILMQREELALQREELRATRSELARSASANEKANAMIKSQNDRNLLRDISINQTIFHIESFNFEHQHDNVGTKYNIQFTISNKGALARDIELSIPSQFYEKRMGIERFSSAMPRDGSKSSNLFVDKIIDTGVRIKISYIDIFNISQNQELFVPKRGVGYLVNQTINSDQASAPP
jgi:hypothetical protein